MKLNQFILGLAIVAISVARLHGQVGEEVLQKENRKISNDSGLSLVVRGKSNHMRMSIASITSTRMRQLRKLFEEGPDYEGDRTIFVDLYEEGQSQAHQQRVVTRVSSFEGAEIVIEMLVDVRGKLEHEQVHMGATEAALLRRGLEGMEQLEAGQHIAVPAWLVHGLDEAIAWKEGASKRRIYEHLLAHPNLLPLDWVFLAGKNDVQSLDSVKYSLYRASSCALVMSLLEQDGGKQAMASFLNDVVTFEGEVDILLRKHFPDMGVGANAIEKVWSLQVAMMAAPKLIDTLGMLETDRLLEQALSLSIQGEDQGTILIPVHEFRKVIVLEDHEIRQSVNGMRAKLSQLSNRCHPVYRPIIFGYITVADDIAAARYNTIEPRLANMAEERQNILAADLRCRDYLDWFQITRARNVTGDFSGYMKLKDNLVREREQRKDEVIDVYLDKVQRLMTQ